MLRRLISLWLCLGVLALGPAPFSACAMLANLPTNCNPSAFGLRASPAPSAKGACEQMHMRHPEQQQVRASLERSCCQLVAPAPDAVTAAKKTAAPEFVAAHLNAKPVSFEARNADAVLPTSPPHGSPLERQSLLCVFLI